MQSNLDDRFENYRRERNRRRLEQGPRRQLGENAGVLRQIEEAELDEVRNQRLTREVHEFFAEATRKAAGIVSTFAQNAEEEQALAVAREMSEFLTQTIRRAQEFVDMVRASVSPSVSLQDFDPMMHNLVGPVLDGFRHEGTSRTSEAHIGRDPFAVPGGEPEKAQSGAKGAAQSEAKGGASAPDAPVAEVEEHLAAELCAGEQDDDPDFDTTPQSADRDVVFQGWWERVSDNPDLLRTVLKVLVSAGTMTKDEGRAIWRAVQGGR